MFKKNKKSPEEVAPQAVVDVDGVAEDLERELGVDLDGDGVVGQVAQGGLEDAGAREELEALLVGDVGFDEPEREDVVELAPAELSGEDYLQQLVIDDGDLAQVDLSDYNIQEDVILAEGKKKFPLKKVAMVIFGMLLCFLSVMVIAFLNNYNIVPENVRGAVWSNGSYSAVPKNYMVDFNDLEYGMTVMYVENTNEIMPSYHYGTIIDKKLKSPRAIKIFDNSSAVETAVALDNILYIVIDGEEGEGDRVEASDR